MTRIFNVKQLKERRRELRNNQTPAEKKLWQFIRRKQLHEIQFYRQYGIGPYIADFYAPSIKLCIEVDGHQHYTSNGMEYDSERDNYMNALNITVVRFRNKEVLQNITKIVDIIEKKIC
ncbi:MAG: endonuclease domain-containing protein, partial [Candidatus Tenebribacter mawsonii]|nr:endonuclease domain-containing protein [Candidatus Tenebribacter mawsonii]